MRRKRPAVSLDHSGRLNTHGEVPGDRVGPSAELVPAVILMTAFQHPHPCFLEQVFGDGTICRQAHKVTQPSMLVLLDKTVQQVRVSPAKATSDSAGLGLHPVHEVAGGRVHANGYTGEHLKKMHGAVAGPSETFHARAP